MLFESLAWFGFIGFMICLLFRYLATDYTRKECYA